MLIIKFHPESNKREFIQAAKEYQSIWKEDGKRVVDAIEKASTLKFVEKLINALIFEGRSRSYPLQLRASYSKEVKKARLIHELCHRLLSGNNLEVKIKYGTKRHLVAHKQINLILYDIWVDLYGKGFADEMVKEESNLAPYYKKAWEYALSFTREERMKKFLELIKSRL